MPIRTALLTILPATCAVFIVLGLTVLRPAHASDLTLGLSTGILIGFSILSTVSIRRRNLFRRTEQ